MQCPGFVSMDVWYRCLRTTVLQLFFLPNRGSSLWPVCAVSEGRSWREAGVRDDGIRGFPALVLLS